MIIVTVYGLIRSFLSETALSFPKMGGSAIARAFLNIRVTDKPGPSFFVTHFI